MVFVFLKMEKKLRLEIMISLYSIPKFIALFSGVYAVIIFFLFSVVKIEISVLNVITYTTIFELTVILILMFTWKWIWNVFPALNNWFFPDINGTWNVEIHWNWTQQDGTIKNGVKKGEVVIRQNFLNISMELFTDESESETLIIQPEKNSKSNRLTFHYIYKNTPKNNCNNKLLPHIGTAILKISPDTNTIIEGNYFTDRNTKGVLKFIKD